MSRRVRDEIVDAVIGAVVLALVSAVLCVAAAHGWFSA